MSVLGRLRSPDERSSGPLESPREGSGLNVRRSNGLKDFLWLMPEQPSGRLLDLGPVAQSTVTFFTDRDFRVSTEDLVRGWAQWESERKAERDAQREATGSGLSDSEPPDPSLVAAEFLAANLRFDQETFHGILAWDAFDFVPAELLGPLATRLYSLLVGGGVLLAIFHDATDVEPVRYRVRDNENVEMIPVRQAQKVCRAFQNREILSLFSGFRSSRTYVGRDHLREALFLK